jgi:AraC family transcriptional regulator, regulatory protein of adaptative response / methylated-DNA-[protein]-cysteine methyltransferase
MSEDPRCERVLARDASADGHRADDEIRFAVGQSSLGSVLVARSRRGICAILLGDHRQALVQELRGRFPEAGLAAAESGGDRDFEKLVARVVELLEAPVEGAGLPLDLRGTQFQRRVWQALRGIPAGTTVSYSDLAARIGAPQAVRAVAQACAANVLAVVIPCHRVVRRDGGLSGYRWGEERKRRLLEREARA